MQKSLIIIPASFRSMLMNSSCTTVVNNARKIGVSIAIVLVTTIFLLSQSQTGFAQQTLMGCNLLPSYLPSDRTQMNTVEFDSLVKTVYVEKKLFVCEEFTPSIIADVSTYIEIVEDASTQVPIKKSFEIVTCGKNLDGTVLGCVSDRPSNVLPTTTCENTSPLTHITPLRLNTIVNVPVGISKTIEAATEVFGCDFVGSGNATQLPTKLKDVTIFTGAFQNVRTETMKRNIEVATCITELDTAKVLACNAHSIDYK